MHQIIDTKIPERATWHTNEITLDDYPDLIYTIRFRDCIEAIHSLWGDPALSQHIVYRSTKIFSDSSMKNRIYTEIWTGKWWASIQVCIKAFE